ncbi:response regulator [Flavobacterium sp. MFBS3-15]|uniref:response regulator n=1 Tax=Flavobacterium sp. MFBS3-15 TaxID=2989816 RepID=UPI00223682E3|nr:response regulator [Flavobacterium sp. MFBS3-15]MCW4467574.1 response regulator [Flavobacterium sp. MFBS3-15]
MNRPVNCIMLIDDNKIDNFFHERVIRKCDAATHIIPKGSAIEALAHCQNGEMLPDIIFLDVNMPGMNGWEFIAEFSKLPLHQKCLIVVMTNDYDEPEDEALEAVQGIFHDFRPKPVTQEMLEEVIAKYYS